MRRQTRAKRAPIYCSFCGKAQHEVRHIVAGPQVFICNECVNDAQRIIAGMEINAGIRPAVVADPIIAQINS